MRSRRELDELDVPEVRSATRVSYESDLHTPQDLASPPTLLEQMAQRPDPAPPRPMLLGTSDHAARNEAWLAEWEAEFDAPATANAIATPAPAPLVRTPARIEDPYRLREGTVAPEPVAKLYPHALAKASDVAEACRLIEAALVDHARRELGKAGLMDADSDYGGMLGKSVLKLCEAMEGQGHSGFSAQMAVDLFGKLARYQALTPLTDDPAEWRDVSALSFNDEQVAEGKGLWQNVRQSSAFSEDGGKTYTLLEETIGPDSQGEMIYHARTPPVHASQPHRLAEARGTERCPGCGQEHPAGDACPGCGAKTSMRESDAAVRGTHRALVEGFDDALKRSLAANKAKVSGQWDESKVNRGKTTPQSNRGSFAPGDRVESTETGLIGTKGTVAGVSDGYIHVQWDPTRPGMPPGYSTKLPSQLRAADPPPPPRPTVMPPDAIMAQIEDLPKMGERQLRDLVAEISADQMRGGDDEYMAWLDRLYDEANKVLTSRPSELPPTAAARPPANPPNPVAEILNAHSRAERARALTGASTRDLEGLVTDIGHAMGSRKPNPGIPMDQLVEFLDDVQEELEARRTGRPTRPPRMRPRGQAPSGTGGPQSPQQKATALASTVREHLDRIPIDKPLTPSNVAALAPTLEHLARIVIRHGSGEGKRLARSVQARLDAVPDDRPMRGDAAADLGADAERLAAIVLAAGKTRGAASRPRHRVAPKPPEAKPTPNEAWKVARDAANQRLKQRDREYGPDRRLSTQDKIDALVVAGLAATPAEARMTLIDMGEIHEAAITEAVAPHEPPRVRPEDDPGFNWRRDGGRRGVILKDGTPRVVDPETFDRLKRMGALDDSRTPQLRGDVDEPDLEYIDGYYDQDAGKYEPPMVYSAGEKFPVGARVTGLIGGAGGGRRIVGNLSVEHNGVITVAGRKVKRVQAAGEHLTPPDPTTGGAKAGGDANTGKVASAGKERGEDVAGDGGDGDDGGGDSGDGAVTEAWREHLHPRETATGRFIAKMGAAVAAGWRDSPLGEFINPPVWPPEETQGPAIPWSNPFGGPFADGMRRTLDEDPDVEDDFQREQIAASALLQNEADAEALFARENPGAVSPSDWLDLSDADADDYRRRARRMREATRPSRPEDHPDFNWRRDGNGKRGVVLTDGRKAVVDGPTFDRLKREGRIHRSTPTLRGDADTGAPSAGAAAKPDEQSDGRVKAHLRRSASGKVSRVRDFNRAVQRKVGATPDGVNGPQTRAAVKAFQRKHGLQVDGIVGKQTASAMLGNKAASKVKPGAIKADQYTRLAARKKPRAAMQRGRARGGAVIG